MKKILISIITLLLVILIPVKAVSGDGFTEPVVKTINICSRNAVKVTDEPVNITRYTDTEHYEIPWANVIITVEDFDLLCHTVYREAGNQSLEAQILVARVILFRVMSESFPNTVHEVIYQRNPTQFNVIDLPDFPESYPYAEKTEEAVYLAIATYPFEPRNVLYFRSGHYFENLERYDKKGEMYFSYGKE